MKAETEEKAKIEAEDKAKEEEDEKKKVEALVKNMYPRRGGAYFNSHHFKKAVFPVLHDPRIA